jgi:acyl-CoA thioesterase FadM
MYPYLRAARVLLAARLGSRVDFDQEGSIRLRVWPGDIDIFWELNNGRFLTLMDMGRLDVGMRCGLLGVLHRRGWGLTVGGASVRFRHRVPPFSRITLTTKLVGTDERWFYFNQRIIRGDRVSAGALVRAAVTSQDGLVAPARVMEALDARNRTIDPPDWVRAWIEAEARRPWP